MNLVHTYNAFAPPSGMMQSYRGAAGTTSTIGATDAYEVGPTTLVPPSEAQCCVPASSVTKYDILLSPGADGPQVDQTSSHAGNFRFSVLLALHRSSGAGEAHPGRGDCAASRIVRSVCAECVPNGRFLLPVGPQDGGGVARRYYRSIGSGREATDVVRRALEHCTTDVAMCLRLKRLPDPPAAAGRRKRERSVTFVPSGGGNVGHSPAPDFTEDHRSKIPRRSSLKGGPAYVENSPAGPVHFSLQIPPSDVTEADVFLRKDRLCPTTNIGNNRLRVMVSMVAARYARSDGADAVAIAEDIVKHVISRRDMADNRGRFLDVNGNKIVEVSTEVAMQAVTACLDDRMKGQMAALLPDPIVEGEGSPVSIDKLRRGAVQDMLERKQRKKIEGTKLHHGGAKGFSSTLNDSQIFTIQSHFRGVGEQFSGIPGLRDGDLVNNKAIAA